MLTLTASTAFGAFLLRSAFLALCMAGAALVLGMAASF